MNIFTRILIILFIFMWMAPAEAQGEGGRVVALIEKESSSTKVILDGLIENGFNIEKIDSNNLDDNFLEGEVEADDKILVFGGAAFSKYLDHQVENDVVVAMVRESVFHHLMEGYSHTSLVTGKAHYPENIGVIYEEASIDSQLELIKKTGQIDDVTVFLSKLTQFKREYISSVGNKLGISLTFIDVDEEMNMTKALNSISKDSALLLLPDWYVFNQKTAKNIYITSFRAKIPVFGYSKGTVSAGSIASYYVEPESVVSEIIEMLKTRPQKRFSSKVKIAVNESVARSLNRLRFLSLDTPSSLVTS